MQDRKINRREFSQLALAGTGALLAGNLDFLAPKRHIGLQLWSIRDVVQKNLIGTLSAVRKMGYREIEAAGYSEGKFYGKSPAEFKKIIADLGLSMPSGHNMMTSADYLGKGMLSDSMKQTIDACAEVGQKFVICPYMIDSDRNEGKVKHLIEGFNAAGEACKKAGMVYGYHNHDFEFVKIGNKTMYEHILDGTDPKLVTMELDLYWSEKGGDSSVNLFKKYPGRFQLVHVKDMAKTEQKETVEVGNGSINFQEIFKSAPMAGVSYFVVELEHYKTTPMEGVAIAYKNLKKLKF
jgi:sugar phosphate isomerase/epimerase